MDFISLKKVDAPGTEIEKTICVLEAAFGIAITVHDVHGRLCIANGDPLLPGRNLHQHPCCIRDRFRESGWSSRCYRDCFSQSELIAGTEVKPYLKNCWKGLQELVVPIVHNSLHVLTLYAGVFRTVNKLPPEAPAQKWFRNLYASLPEAMDEKRMLELSGVLEMLGYGIIAIGMRTVPYKASNSRALALNSFIADNAHRQITLSDLAKHLYLSPSRTAHLAVELTGSSFQTILLQERMARARNLLISTGQKQEEISAAVGFKNCYYFNRAFKKYFGETPGRYRRQTGI